MQKAIEKADVLIEAMGWIRRFRKKVTVIKLGGSIMEDPDALRHVLVDIVFMETVGMKPVVVHGAGAAISRAMDAAGIEPRFIQGRRYTDQATLDIVQRVLGAETNRALTEQIRQLDGMAEGLNHESTNVLFGEPLQVQDGEGQPLDLGLVGQVTRVDTQTIQAVCDREAIPVIPSLCQDETTGKWLNVNADTAAMGVAQALGAEKLVFLSDVNGVRTDKDDPSTHLPSLSASHARSLMADGSIAAGMIPKVEACLQTLQRGVRKVHIVDGNLRHSLLLEIYTTQGVGTEIYADS